jgi:hypothetical protein
LGLDDVIVVQTDGTQVVAVQRMDLSLSDPATRERAQGLALADNRAGEVGLAWDGAGLASMLNEGVDLSAFFRDEELAGIMTAEVAGLEKGADGERQEAEKADGGWAERLIHHPAVNHARDCSFLSVRRWRLHSKDEDMAAFVAAKRGGDDGLLAVMVADCAALVRSALSSPDMCIVTNPPAGASAGKNLPHYAGRLAQGVAKEVGAEYAEVFVPRPRGGGSHPKSWDRRGGMEIDNAAKDRIAGRVVVVVDDISSTGLTMGECREALAGVAQAIGIAWAYSTGVEGSTG